MEKSESKENLVFDYHTIRLLIGFISLSFPWIVMWRAGKITSSLSWSYYTEARDIFVGLLFVIGAFLISYKGHKPTLDKDKISKFWKWISRFWEGAINFRIEEKKHEENLVGWTGGFAAWITALFPTAFCSGHGSPSEPTSIIHYISAGILFSTTVYFCEVAFISRAKDKLKNVESSGNVGKSSHKLRIRFYEFCGWGITVIMVGSIVVSITGFDGISNYMFWAESFALELFGIAWLVASQYLPLFAEKTTR
jgi:hypothetical protein